MKDKDILSFLVTLYCVFLGAGVAGTDRSDCALVQHTCHPAGPSPKNENGSSGRTGFGLVHGCICGSRKPGLEQVPNIG